MKLPHSPLVLRPGAITAALALSALSCGGSNTAGQLAKAPEFRPEGQTKCAVKASQDKPLIVEWPSADRAELEARSRVGVVVVRYDGCEMRVVSTCRAPGRYGYVSVNPKEDTVSIRDEDALYATMPVGAARFEAKLAQAGSLNVAMTMVGQFVSDVQRLRLDELTGECSGATHVMTSYTVGAFEFFAGADAEVGGGGEVLGAGAGARSKASRETLTRDGDRQACGAATGADVAPPDKCGALLRVSVTSLEAPACPSGSAWDGMRCAAAAPRGGSEKRRGTSTTAGADHQRRGSSSLPASSAATVKKDGTMAGAVLAALEAEYHRPELLRSAVMMRAGVESLARKYPAAGAPPNLAPPASLRDLRAQIDQVLGAAVHRVGSAGPKRSELERAFVDGMLGTLDPHTFVFTSATPTGGFGGIGVVFDKTFEIMRVNRDGPGEKSGLLAGDRVEAVDGAPTAGMTLDAVVERIRGEQGTKVELSVRRAGSLAIRSFVLTRAQVTMPAIGESLHLGARIGYVRLEALPVGTRSDLDARIAELARDAGGQLAGLILDLRGSPGGIIEQAVAVADAFIDGGVVVATSSRSPKYKEESSRSAKPGDAHERIPLVVLIDENTSGGSEIIAGALQRRDRAVVLGLRSKGKGTIQVLHDLGSGDHLKVTVAEYLPGGDLPLVGSGVVPDAALLPRAGAGAASPHAARGANRALGYDAAASVMSAAGDPQVLLAKELLLAAPEERRSSMVNKAEAFFAKHAQRR